MATPVIRFALDPSGVSPNNLVINEVHTLDANVRVRAIAPRYGAFYSNSLVVRDLTTNTQLTPIQYSCVELLQDATMRFGQGVYMMILITDTTVSSSISINYQVVGGDYQNSADTVVTAWETLMGDNRPVDWSNVLNKPTQYPPSLHEHLLTDVYGFQSVVLALERVRNAIALSDVPTLQAVIDWAWSNWGGMQSYPVATQEDIETGIPAKKYITFDMLLYLLDIYKGGSKINTYLNTLNLAQGFKVNVLVNTVDYPQDTILYWSVVNVSTSNTDFATTSGLFPIINNTGQFSVQVLNEIPTLGQELFRIQIRKDSPQGAVVALTDMVTIAYQVRLDVQSPELMLLEGLFDNPYVSIDPETYFLIPQ